VSTRLTNGGQCRIAVQVDLLQWVEMPCLYMLFKSSGGRRICKPEDCTAWIKIHSLRALVDKLRVTEVFPIEPTSTYASPEYTSPLVYVALTLNRDRQRRMF